MLNSAARIVGHLSPLGDDTPSEQGFAAGFVELMFDHVPRAAFWVKDTDLRFVSANAAMLHLCGARDRAELIGFTARDFFPEGLCIRHEDADRQVLQSMRPVRDQLELCCHFQGEPAWVLLNRWPILTHGKATGLAALARVLPTRRGRNNAYARLAGALDQIHKNLSGAIEVEGLAKSAMVSVSQLERDFTEVFGMPPRRYLAKMRLEMAMDLLRTNSPIAEVALACGYADQSAFTRRFRSAIGMAPSEFRRRDAQRESGAALAMARD